MKRRFIGILASLILVVMPAMSLVQPGVARAEDHNYQIPQPVANNMTGSGIQGDPFVITNCQNLQDITMSVASNYILGNDIDCSASSSWNDGTGFIPIGSHNTPGPTASFTGTLDGHGHTISNLYINRTNYFTSNYVGLFSNAYYATLLNFSLNNATIIGIGEAGGIQSQIGGIAGNVVGGTISRIQVEASIHTPSCSNSQYDMGGLVGTATNAAISMSSSDGSITTYSGSCDQYRLAAGGLIGRANNQTIIEDSYSTIDITSSGVPTELCLEGCRQIGGLIGRIGDYDTAIINSYASGALTIDTHSQYLAYNVGGLAGAAFVGTYTNSFSVSPINVNDQCGEPGPEFGCDTFSVRKTGGLIGNTHDVGGNYAGAFYDAQATGQDHCDDYDIDNPSSCSQVNFDGNEAGYFENNSSNDPLSYWNFSDVWQTIDNGPPILRQDSHPNPDAPTNLQASIEGLTKIALSWDIPAQGNLPWQDITGYHVLCQKVNTSTWFICSYDVDDEADTVIIQDLLEEGTQYNIKMVSYDSGGYTSDASETIVGSTGTPGFNLITSCEDLQNIQDDLTAHYELAHDIDCSDTVNWNNGTGFQPIGSFNFETAPETQFSGILAGNNYAIRNLYSNQQTGDAVGAGIFGGANGALIQDLTMENPTVVSRDQGVASAVVNLAMDTTITNVHVSNGSISGDAIALGGIAGVVINNSDLQIVHSKNSFTGTLNASGESYYIGGLYAATSSGFDLENSYADAEITVQEAMATGGLIGIVDFNQSGNGDIMHLSNSYAAGSMTSEVASGENGETVAGGFVGGIVGSDVVVSNTFAHQAMSGFGYTSGWSTLFDRNDINGLNNNYFDADQAGTPTCAVMSDYACSGISGQPNYFKNNSTNPPLNSWDFEDIWNTSDEFPVFSEKVLTTITAIDPARLNPTIPGGGSGGGSVDVPAGPANTDTISKAVIGAAVTTGGPTDETGILGAIKHFVRSLPAGVVTAFPYALFGLLFIAVLVLLIELYRELRRLRLLQILIHKQQLLAEERDAFWHLAANYLRAPVTLIVGGAEALNDVKSTKTTVALGAIASSLQSKIAGIMQKIEGSTSLQAISHVQPRQTKQVARRAVFIIPVLTVAILALLGNYAAASFRNMSPGAAGYALQLAGFVLVSVLFYWVLGALTQGKNKRQQAEKLLEQQTDSLANARHELIADTAKQINPDLTQLETTLGKLTAKQAATEPAKTLQEGSSRLREIVTSFGMLIKVQEDTGQVAAHAKAIDLTGLLNKTRAKLTPQITAKGVRVVAPTVPLAITAEADLANQVLESIISNAVDYSPANGTVKVEAQRLQDKIRLRITDQGKGIDKKQLDHLFQPFVRTDGTSAMDMSHGGFGINLYLDKLIMEQIGGSISATSTPGKGTAITMEWPVSS